MTVFLKNIMEEMIGMTKKIIRPYKQNKSTKINRFIMEHRFKCN